MKYVSTRGSAAAASLSQAIEQGLAADGGLYVPEALPRHAGMEALHRAGSPARIAEPLLGGFFEGDGLARELAEIASEALSFPLTLKPLGSDTSVLELFHGPTAAFKDVGARFLAGCFARIPLERPRTILVATSGDTGGAVASAFHGRAGVEVAVLFPRGGVSPLQERQLTCWGGNVRSIAVRGTFDDCQRLVKEAFAQRESVLPSRHLTSANSINIGRLLPQMLYYAWACLEYQSVTGEAPGFVIPSGNVGNAMAAAWVMAMGLPVREIVLATNANHVVPEYFASGRIAASPTIKTLANAMDVGNPSNLERLAHLLHLRPELRARMSSFAVSDDEIRDTISRGPGRYGETWCPHTAVAVHARERINSGHWIVVATAHPAKFGDIVAPLVGGTVTMPAQLRELLGRESRCQEIGAELAELRGILGA